MEEEVCEFSTVISRLISGHYEGNTVIFKKYLLVLLEGWKPFPYLPDEFFQRCIFACAADEAIKKASALGNDGNPHSHHKGAQRSAATTDFTGSPLEFVFDFSVIDKSFLKDGNLTRDMFRNPLPVCDSRKLCAMYSKCRDVSDCGCIPLYVFCDAEDRKRTVLIGLSADKRLIAFNQGTVKRKDHYSKLSSIKRKHLRGFSKTFSKVEGPKNFFLLAICRKLPIDMSMYAYYDILRYSSEAETLSALKPAENGLLALECIGTRLSSILQKPPADSSCTVLIQAILGDEHAGASAKYRELKFVQALFSCLNTGELAWPAESQCSNVTEKLVQFFEGLKSSRGLQSAKEKPLNADSSDFDAIFAAYVTDNRDDMDFTDHLWSILCGCSSYAELTNAFETIFREVKDLPSTPYIYQKNSTTLAKLVQSIREQTPACLSLEPPKPIKLLLEIGIEKLKKDYTLLFVGLELVPYVSLEPFLRQFHHLESGVNCLQKFHTVVELLIICWSLLHLPREELSGFVRFAFNHYACVPTVDPCHVFRFPLLLCSVKDALDRIKPVIWQAALKSTDGEFEKQTYIHFSRKADECETKPSIVYRPVNPVYYASSAVLFTDNCGSNREELFR